MDDQFDVDKTPDAKLREAGEVNSYEIVFLYAVE